VIMPVKTPSKDQPTRILIVDDHPVVREGLAMLIARQPDLEVCGEAADVPEAVRQASATSPDVAVIDIGLQTGNGLDLIRRLKARNERLRILVWSMFGERLYAERAIHAGALGYITKEQATDQIIDAIRRVREGKVYVSGDLAEQLPSRVIGRKPEARSPIDTLSDRELEAFQLIGQGSTTESIAEKMHVSPKTVETFRARIKEKLGLSNMTELIQRAAQWVLEAN